MTTKKVCTHRGDVRREALLAVASKLFLEKGFGGTSVNEIVRRAGGSLATLYAMFPSKEALFKGIVQKYCERIMAPLQVQGSEQANVEDVLTDIGRAYVAVLSDPESLAMHRLLVAEGPRFESLRSTVLTVGIGKGQAELGAYLEQKSEEGLLLVADSKVAVSQFLSLLRGSWHIRAAIGDDVPTPVQLEEVVQGAVAMFMAYYGRLNK